MSTRFRYLLVNRHFYLSLIIVFLIFSPVLIWNYQHQWQSFIYQLNIHRIPILGNPLFNGLKSLIKVFVPSLNFMLIPPFLYWIKCGAKKSLPLYLCLLICIVFLGFYLLTAGTSVIRQYWLTQFLISSALLGGYCFQKFKYYRTTYTLIALYITISSGILINGFFHFTDSKSFAYYRIIQKLNADYPTLPKIVLSSGWFEARMLFFLKNKPLIYTLNCGALQNQYGLWSENLFQHIKNTQIKDVLYIDTTDQIKCIKPYFKHCQKLSTIEYQGKHYPYKIFAYRCNTRLKI